jgi:hypothetical protein
MQCSVVSAKLTWLRNNPLCSFMVLVVVVRLRLLLLVAAAEAAVAAVLVVLGHELLCRYRDPAPHRRAAADSPLPELGSSVGWFARRT